MEDLFEYSLEGHQLSLPAYDGKDNDKDIYRVSKPYDPTVMIFDHIEEKE